MPDGSGKVVVVMAEHEGHLLVPGGRHVDLVLNDVEGSGVDRALPQWITFEIGGLFECGSVWSWP